MSYNNRKFKGSIEAYNRRFDQSMSGSESISENEKIGAYTKGLKYYVAREVKYRKPDSIEEAKSIAKAFGDD